MNRQKVVILFGGKSVEHDISIRSASNVYQYIDKDRFEVVLIGISRVGGWYLCQSPEEQIDSGQQVALVLTDKRASFLNLVSNQAIDNIAVVFPVLHGTDGEDGSVQGLLKAGALPCVGSGVLGSANSMDKLVTKRLLLQAGIPSAKYLTYSYSELDQISYDFIVEELGSPFIIKPVNLGSSVGVEKVSSKDRFEQQVERSFAYDSHILIEQFVQGREFEIGIMGNEDPESTVPGEVILDPQYDFYSFEAKYLDPEAAQINIPAQLSDDVIGQAKNLAERAFIALGCNDYARVDFFVTVDNRVLINEINTIPGFTDISMFPKLWDHEGIAYSKLISKIIGLTLERSAKLERLTTDFESALSRSPS